MKQRCCFCRLKGWAVLWRRFSLKLIYTVPPTPLIFSTNADIFWKTFCFLVKYCGFKGLIFGNSALSSVPFSLAYSFLMKWVMYRFASFPFRFSSVYLFLIASAFSVYAEHKTTRGVEKFIAQTNVYDAGGVLTEAEFDLNVCEPVFKYGEPNKGIGRQPPDAVNYERMGQREIAGIAGSESLRVEPDRICVPAWHSVNRTVPHPGTVLLHITAL